MEITGLVNSTVSRWLRVLHKSSLGSRNIVYVADWKRTSDRGNWAACWKLGYGEFDVLKPARMPDSEYRKRWERKRRGDVKIKVTKKGIKHVVK